MRAEAGAVDWVAWRERVLRLVALFCAGFERHFSYPPGENEVGGPTRADELDALVDNGTVDIPMELVDFYRHIAEVSLPDLDNGYFIHSAQRVADGLRLDPPSDAIEVVYGLARSPVLQIGSDGGGGLYVLERGLNGRVIYLPVGELRDGVYTGNQVTPPRFEARSLEGLLVDWEARLRAVVADMAGEAHGSVCGGGG